MKRAEVVLLTLAERAAGAAASVPCEIEKKRLEKAKVSRRRRAFEEETLDILKKGPFVCWEGGGGSGRSRDGRWR
ncbi:hypothetical protein N9M16_02930 [Candidatus Dependentiae bacterium]|nr:hypothetical protein [Candidatus Dependentiae bacterium]